MTIVALKKKYADMEKHEFQNFFRIFNIYTIFSWKNCDISSPEGSIFQNPSFLVIFYAHVIDSELRA